MTRAPRTDRTDLLILSGITLIGLALRIYHLDYQSLWFDELHSIVPTDPENSISSLIEYCKRDQPPGYFIFLHYFLTVFGYNEVVGRCASVLLGVAAIPAMYFFGKEIKGPGVGIAAALLTSLNYMHIYYSQELRFYTMVFLTTTLSFLFLIRAYKRGKNQDFILYCISTTALLYTHYYGLVIFAAQAIIFLLLLVYRRDPAFLIRSAIAGACVAIFYLPWLPVILSDLQIASFWIRKPEPTFLADYFYYYFGKDAIVTILFIFLIVIFSRAFLRKEMRSSDLKPVYMVLVAWLVLSYLIPYIKSVIGTPMLYVRYTMVSLPAWILIISIGWDELRNNRIKYGFLVVVSLSMILNLFFFRKHYVRIDKQQFREVSEFIKEANSQYPVYSLFAWHYDFYFRDHRIEVKEFDPAEVVGLDGFWLLQVEFFDPSEKQKVIETVSDEFEIAETHPFHKTDAVLLRRISR